MIRKGSAEEKNKSKAKKQEKKLEKSTQLSKDVLRFTKQGFTKIKNRIGHTVNKKKLVQLIKKSANTIPHLLTKQQSKALLPKLQKIILPTLQHNKSAHSISNFQEIQGKLTHSMVMFRKNAELERNDLWAIELQTQKCYKMIPSFYFKQHMNSEQLTRNLVLTKNYRDMQENVLTLGDFLDQVQFNINQQANAKIKIFMNFVICTNSIQDLVNINLTKLRATRKHTGLLRDIIVSRAVRINQCRLKKQKVQEALEILNLLKKLKSYETKLLAQITVGNFIPHDSKTKLGAIFHQYCELHNVELNKLCCQTGKNRCKYWDITYFVERGFQDNFMKVLRNYLFEVINYHREIDNFKKVLTVNKKNFMTTPNSAQNSEASVNVDESFEVEGIQNVELFTKIYIQKQIISLFEQGIHRYSFSTDSLQKQLKQFLSIYMNNFLKQALGASDNDSKTLRDLNEVQSDNFYESQKCKQKTQKLSWALFCNLIDMVLLRFEYLSTRLMSLVQKLLEKAAQLQQQSPQRYQVFCAYMSQLIGVVTQQSDTYIAAILQNRIKDSEKSLQLFKSKEDIIKQFDTQAENMKRLVRYCKKWTGHVESLQKTYALTKKSFDRVLAKSHKNIEEQANVWAPKVEQLKASLVKSTYELLHKTITSRDLKQKLQQQRWQFIDIKTHIYNDLGYIIGGKDFLALQQRNHKESLSKSILMQKSLTEMQRTGTQYNKEQYSSRFKINPTYITLGTHLKFKLTSSTEQMIQFLRKYLEMYDDISDKRKKADLQAKLTEMILMYNQYVKDLILKGQAVKLEKIRTKSITARHLIVTYMQLQLVDYIYTGEFVQKRVGFTKDDVLVMHEKILGTQLEIRKKYQKVIEMRILDTIEGLNLKQGHWLESQGMQSIPKNLQSSIELFSELMLNECEYEKFIDMEPNWAAELLSKVSKGPKGKQCKIKCFTFLMEQIKPITRYLPKLTTAVKSVLN